MESLLILLLFFPLVGIPALLFAPAKAAKVIALATSLIAFGLSVYLYQQYVNSAPLEATGGGFVFESAYRWLGEFSPSLDRWLTRYDVKFILGVDGISIYLILLTTFLFPLSILFSFTSVSTYEKAYYALLLMLEVGVLGVFLSLDLLVFYIFFEVGLIPMYFLILLWGGYDRIYAGIKFFLYTLLGSFVMLIALLYLGSYAGDMVNGGIFTTDLFKIQQVHLPFEMQFWMFLAFALAFSIKVPLFPLHTWLPDAHVQAPTAGSVLLAGVLLKLGTYGLVRFCLPLFPEASVYFAPLMAVLAVIGIVYGAMAAMVQTDIKKLIAYSSVAHMGFVILGTFAMTKEALSGAVLQMVNHGISTGALFLIVGMVYDRRHTREIKEIQGIAKVMPVFTLFFMLATMSSIGLPGMNGFVGEFLILIGSFGSKAFSPVLTIIATSGVIIAAVYMLWMFRRVMFGELDRDENRNLTDLTPLEVGILIPLVVLMFVIGFYATPFLTEIGRSSDSIVNLVNSAATGLAQH